MLSRQHLVFARRWICPFLSTVATWKMSLVFLIFRIDVFGSWRIGWLFVLLLTL